MGNNLVKPGTTCHIGKGRTLWEIIKVNDNTHMLELSALGKGGYSNRSISADEANSLLPQRLETPLRLVIETRTRARTYAHELNDRLRYCSPEDALRLAGKVRAAVQDYATAKLHHSQDLVGLGIKED